MVVNVLIFQRTSIKILKYYPQMLSHLGFKPVA